MLKQCVLIVGILAVCTVVQSQCIVINEILVNGPGSNDGSNSPNTEEWVELYNTCATPVDIGCYVIADGDFTVTIPVGTIMQPFEHFTIGSINAGFPVDLNWGSCACASGSAIGIFTNGNEQLILSDPAGVMVDAIYWGSGQFPASNNSIEITGCTALSLFYDGTEAGFSQMPNGGSNGCTLARSCDGAENWIEQCSPTPDLSNGQGNATAQFSASLFEFCAGSCIDFFDESVGEISGWTWTFEGAQTTLSTDQNPTSICYSSEGFYDVTLALSSSCGVSTFTANDFIHVTAAPVPSVAASGPTEFCQGDEVVLSTQDSGSLQWFLDGVEIPGAQNSQFIATVSGVYSLSVTNGSCIGYSVDVEVNVMTDLNVPIVPSGSIEICEGNDVLLSVVGTFDSYQWMLDGNEILDATGAEYTASESGNFSVTATLGFCNGTSEIVSITLGNNLLVNISPSVDQLICVGDHVELTSFSNYQNYAWYFNGQEIPGASNATFDAIEQGEYFLQVTDGNCSGTSESVFVTVSEPIIPVIIPNTDQTICEGDTITFITSLNFDTYQWYLNQIPLSSSVIGSISIYTTGVVTLVTTNGGCEAMSEGVTVLVEPTPDSGINPSGPLTICEGDMVVLTAIADLNEYQWCLNGVELAGENANQLTANSPGSYSLVVTNQNCSSTSEDVIVSLTQLPVVSITPVGDVQTCSSAMLIQATSNAPVQWYHDGSIIFGANSLNYAATTDGTYYFIASNGNCSTTSEVVNLIFLEDLNIHISASNELPCEGEVVELSATDGFESYLWSNGQTAQEISVNAGGTYSVTGTNGICSDNANYDLLFEELPVVNAGPDTLSPCDEGLQLYAYGEGELAWLPNSTLDDLGGGSAFVSPDVNTIYTLTVSNDNCRNNDDVLVMANCTEVHIPNIFTPNGDGKNDMFEIQARGVVKFDLRIFDRWGVLVFESKSPSNKWNGKSDGGDVVDGTYFWILDALDQNGTRLLSTQDNHGVVTILR